MRKSLRVAVTATHLPLQGRLFSAKRWTKSSSLSALCCFFQYTEKRYRGKSRYLSWRRRRDSTGFQPVVFALRTVYFISLFAPQKDGRRVRVSLLSAVFFNIQKKGTGENPDTFPGAEGETRTLAPVTRPTPLAGAPRHQLEYFCMVTYIIKFCCCRWRREWDSNPRYVAVRRFSRPFRYNHFGISPY